MGNPRGKPPRSDEAIAFAVVGQVLGITVEHADAGGGDGMVDGLWTYPDDHRAALEVTAGEASKEIGAERRAWRGGKPTDRNGSLSLDDLTGQLSKRLAEPWMEPNLAKLRAVRADETHLYLWGLGREDDFLYSTDTEGFCLMVVDGHRHREDTCILASVRDGTSKIELICSRDIFGVRALNTV